MKREESLRLGDYEVHRAWEGFASVRQISSGEIMHSRTAPMEEANRLYVEQSNLAARLRRLPNEDAESAEPLVIWDVGLGAAANAMAAVNCFEHEATLGTVRRLRIISFENDLDSLRLALRHLGRFPYLRQNAITAILNDGAWRSDRHPGLSWLLQRGDFLETMTHAPAAPDLIFYDMFSTKTSGDLWTLAAFRQVFEACAERAVELFTYTCSTANRAALLAAGFHVARGHNAGEKLETTIALTPAADRSNRQMLSRNWLEKWSRSAAKFPENMGAGERPRFEKIIREHEQFRRVGGPETFALHHKISE